LREPHAKLHLAGTVIVVALGWWFILSPTEWLAVTLTAGLVWSTEAMNTAIECLADRVCQEPDPLIGQVKDLAAGAVLLASLAALVVGAIIFLPRLITF
jgi:diacylglycerol kinase